MISTPSGGAPADAAGAVLAMALVETLGEDLLAELTREAGCDHAPPGRLFACRDALFARLAGRFGERGGAGLALRCGRAAFRVAMGRYGQRWGLLAVSFRMLPPRQRLPNGGRLLAEGLGADLGLDTAWAAHGSQYTWLVGREADFASQPGRGLRCAAWVGFLQEFLGWISGGKIYPVRETSCAASSQAACVFSIPMKAIE